MIVLEGCDCAGKTTLAMELIKRIGTKLRRFERYGLLPEWWDYRWMYVRSCERWSVIDRFVVSEFVYGTVWRLGANLRLSEDNLRLLRERMNQVGAVTVHVRPPQAVINHRLSARGDALLKADEVGQVVQLYDEYLSSSRDVITDTPVVIVTGCNVMRDADAVMTSYEEAQREVDR